MMLIEPKLGYTQENLVRKTNLPTKVQVLFVGNVRVKNVQAIINVNTTRNNVKGAKSLDILLNHVYAKRTNMITVNMNINIKEAMLIEQ